MTDTTEIHIKFFRHFSERLALRYNILITFEEYLELCKIPVEIIDIQTKLGKRSLIGYLEIKQDKVKVVKHIHIKGSPLSTALPIKHVFKQNKK